MMMKTVRIPISIKTTELSPTTPDQGSDSLVPRVNRPTRYSPPSKAMKTIKRISRSRNMMPLAYWP